MLLTFSRPSLIFYHISHTSFTFSQTFLIYLSHLFFSNLSPFLTYFSVFQTSLTLSDTSHFFSHCLPFSQTSISLFITHFTFSHTSHFFSDFSCFSHTYDFSHNLHTSLIFSHTSLIFFSNLSLLQSFYFRIVASIIYFYPAALWPVCKFLTSLMAYLCLR